MNENLLILGAGPFGQMVKEIAESMGSFGKIDFLDDNNRDAIGKLSDYQAFSHKYRYAVVAIGNPYIRLSWLSRLAEAEYLIAVIVSPRAYISPSAQLMQGTIVEPMAIVQANSVVSEGCIISSGAVVRHNAFLEEACHIDCNAVAMSGIVIPAKTKVNACEVYHA